MAGFSLVGFWLQELLYSNRHSENQADHPSSGSVSLVFETSDGTVLRFKRAIVKTGSADNPSYSSRYCLDEQAISMDAFMQKLLSVGINTRARNFLVFQVCVGALVGVLCGGSTVPSRC